MPRTPAPPDHYPAGPDHHSERPTVTPAADMRFQTIYAEPALEDSAARLLDELSTYRAGIAPNAAPAEPADEEKDTASHVEDAEQDGADVANFADTDTIPLADDVYGQKAAGLGEVAAEDTHATAQTTTDGERPSIEHGETITVLGSAALHTTHPANMTAVSGMRSERVGNRADHASPAHREALADAAVGATLKVTSDDTGTQSYPRLEDDAPPNPSAPRTRANEHEPRVQVTNENPGRPRRAQGGMGGDGIDRPNQGGGSDEFEEGGDDGREPGAGHEDLEAIAGHILRILSPSASGESAQGELEEFSADTLHNLARASADNHGGRAPSPETFATLLEALAETSDSETIMLPEGLMEEARRLATSEGYTSSSDFLAALKDYGDTDHPLSPEDAIIIERTLEALRPVDRRVLHLISRVGGDMNSAREAFERTGLNPAAYSVATAEFRRFATVVASGAMDWREFAVQYRERRNSVLVLMACLGEPIDRLETLDSLRGRAVEALDRMVATGRLSEENLPHVKEIYGLGGDRTPKSPIEVARSARIPHARLYEAVRRLLDLPVAGRIAAIATAEVSDKRDPVPQERSHISPDSPELLLMLRNYANPAAIQSREDRVIVERTLLVLPAWQRNVLLSLYKEDGTLESMAETATRMGWAPRTASGDRGNIVREFRATAAAIANGEMDWRAFAIQHPLRMHNILVLMGCLGQPMGPSETLDELRDRAIALLDHMAARDYINPRYIPLFKEFFNVEDDRGPRSQTEIALAHGVERSLLSHHIRRLLRLNPDILENLGLLIKLRNYRDPGSPQPPEDSVLVERTLSALPPWQRNVLLSLYKEDGTLETASALAAQRGQTIEVARAIHRQSVDEFCRVATLIANGEMDWRAFAIEHPRARNSVLVLMACLNQQIGPLESLDDLRRRAATILDRMASDGHISETYLHRFKDIWGLEDGIPKVPAAIARDSGITQGALHREVQRLLRIGNPQLPYIASPTANNEAEQQSTGAVRLSPEELYALAENIDRNAVGRTPHISAYVELLEALVAATARGPVLLPEHAIHDMHRVALPPLPDLLPVLKHYGDTSRPLPPVIAAIVEQTFSAMRPSHRALMASLFKSDGTMETTEELATRMGWTLSTAEVGQREAVRIFRSLSNTIANGAMDWRAFAIRYPARRYNIFVLMAYLDEPASPTDSSESLRVRAAQRVSDMAARRQLNPRYLTAIKDIFGLGEEPPQAPRDVADRLHHNLYELQQEMRKLLPLETPPDQ
jgi:hypothetical protein